MNTYVKVDYNLAKCIGNNSIFHYENYLTHQKLSISTWYTLILVHILTGKQTDDYNLEKPQNFYFTQAHMFKFCG